VKCHRLPRRRFHSCLVAAWLPVLCCMGLPAYANENVIEYDPSVAGQLVPKEETEIQVVKEDLDIRFRTILEGRDSNKQILLSDMHGMTNGSPVRAEVTARYRLRNPESESREIQLAFPIVRSGPEERVTTIRTLWHRWKNESLLPETRRGVRASVSLDRKPIEYEYVSFESLFEEYREEWAAGIRAWLSQWPDILEALDGEATDAPKPDPPKPRYVHLPQKVPPRYHRASSFQKALKQIEDWPSSGTPRHLTPERCHLFWLMKHQSWFHRHIEDWDLDFLSFAHAFAFPEANDPVAETLERWGADNVYVEAPTGRIYPSKPLHWADLPNWAFLRLHRRIDFLVYRVELKPRRERTVEVSYSHLVNAELFPIKYHEDLARPNNYWDTYQYTFQYLLRPSRKWTYFGPVHLSLSMEAEEVYAISLPLRYDGQRDGLDRYSLTIPNGSHIGENLYVGIGALVLSKRLKDEKDSRYPGFVDLHRFWEQYEEDPTGSLAVAYLERIAERAAAGAIASEEDYAFWCDKLGISQGENQGEELSDQIAVALRSLRSTSD
jgi:hypothetical protein